jgi:hypothetical protein
VTFDAISITICIGCLIQKKSDVISNDHKPNVEKYQIAIGDTIKIVISMPLELQTTKNIKHGSNNQIPYAHHKERYLATIGIATPSHIGVTRGDHVSWLAMKIVIPMMMMICILHGQLPLICFPPLPTWFI